MAYAAKYENDVFVSYAEVDDKEIVATNGRGWVTSFVDHFETVLHSRLGGRESVKVFFAPRTLGPNAQLAEITDAASHSAVFLAVTSTAYVTRNWTQLELGTFVKASANPRSLFAVEYLPLDDGEHYTDPLDQQSRLRMWEKDTAVSLAAVPLRSTSDAYRTRMHDLVDRIKKQLVAINQAERARPDIGQVAAVIAHDAALRAKGTVFLAQTTDDLEEERLQVQRYLDQLGYLVLPVTNLPGGGDSFRAAVQNDIEQADLYVQLLGPRGGRLPADLPDGYAMTQFKIAAASGKPRLLWHHPDLDAETVADPRHKELLVDEDVVVCGLTQLMQEARHRIDARKRPKPDVETSLSVVFINATKEDLATAQIAEQEFAARHVLATTPLLQGTTKEISDDLDHNMAICDVMVMIYGAATMAWVRGQMLRFIKVRLGKPARMVAIFAGPPEEKPTYLGLTMPGLRRVDFMDGWSPEQIRRVIEEIGL